MMSGTLVETQTHVSPVGVGNAPESGGMPLSDVRGGGDVPAHTKEKRSLSIALSKGLAPAPNGMTPTPQPVRGRVESVPPAAESPAAPVLAVESAVKGSEQRGGEAAQAPSTGGTSIISPLMAQGGMAAVVRDGASDAAVQVPAESSHAGGAVSGGAAAVPGDAMNMGAVREALAQAAGANTAAEPADVDDKRKRVYAPVAHRAKCFGDTRTIPRVKQASTNSLKDDPGTPEECNLFVGDLARNLTEEKLEKAFNQHGRVMSVSIKRDRATGKNLGYGFVKMSSHQEARIAKDAMQGVELGGRRVRVGWAQKNTSLYVGGLEPGITTDMLVREFSRFGPLDKELTAIKPNSKCGFVKYRYRLHAETAKKELNSRPAFGGICPSLHIEWNSVDTSTKNENADGTRSEVTSGNTSVGLSGISGGENDTSTSSGHFRYSRPEGSANSIHVQFEGEQSDVSGVNEAMIKKTFAQWEPLVDVVIPVTRYNGVSPGPRQLPRCWGFVHFPLTPDGERAAKDAIQGLNGTVVAGMKVHCTMSRGAGNCSGRKNGGDRSRRRTAIGGEHGTMMHGGRQGRPTLDSALTPGRAGAWNANSGFRHNNVHMAHHRHYHHLAPSQQQQQHHQAHIQHSQLQQHMHPHQHHVHQHQQHHQVYGYAATSAGSGAAYGHGQYPIAHAVESSTTPTTAGASEMMVQTPYGVAPYPYMSFPYAPAQQGYQMGYHQMYAGYPYQSSVHMDHAMIQGQVATGVQQSATQQAPIQQQGQGQAGTVSPIPQQQQQQQQQAQHLGTQRPHSQLQTQQHQQQHVQQAAQARVAAAHRHMGMHHAMLMSGSNPAAAAHGLNVGVPSYMPMYHQLPQIPPAAGAQVSPESTTDQSAGGVGGGMDGKHGE